MAFESLTFTVKSYLNMLLNWSFATSAIESFRPKPVTKSAVQPLIPITIIKNLFLYLNRFLAETLSRNFIRFHINEILSSTIRLPAVGALGRIRDAAISFNSL